MIRRLTVDTHMCECNLDIGPSDILLALVLPPLRSLLRMALPAILLINALLTTASALLLGLLCLELRTVGLLVVPITSIDG